MSGIIVSSVGRKLSWFLLWGISIFAAMAVASALIAHESNTKAAQRYADPKIASAFAKWWIYTALNYFSPDADTRRQAASKCMDKAVVSSFSQTFWSYRKGIKERIVFIPTYYDVPTYVNGRTICVSMTGDFVSLDDPALASHHAKIDLTVRPDTAGWRVAGWKLAYDPDCSKTIKFLSRALSGKGKPEVNLKALSYFSRAADLERSHSLLPAIDAYSQSIKWNPKFACAYLRRGILRFEAKDYDLAFDDYTKAIELDSTLWFAYFNRALVRSFVVDSAVVLADYDEAIRICPSFPFGYNNRAIQRAVQGDNKGALADYTMAVELAPRDGFSHASRSCQRLKMSDYFGALVDANEAVRLGPASSFSYKTRGDVWSAMGIQFAAQKDYKRAAQLEKVFGRR
jgi:tetratricopeptide (TPR) repeat protein